MDNTKSNAITEGILNELKKRREYLGITLEELGKSLGGKPKSTIYRLENGIYKLNMTTFIEMCAELKISPIKIFNSIPAYNPMLEDF